ncbi:MAG: trypsin-like peptidase domain-containing protein [Elusimicrobia bacterium]|nr:trypsin-like peptidase domain-containing protein [Elusimicrobiota bacterium]
MKKINGVPENLLKTVLALALGAALPASALAASADDDFAAQFGALRQTMLQQTADQRSRFKAATQETGPNDPLLLMQAPLINLVKKVKPSVVELVMSVESEGKKGQALCTGFFTDSSKYLEQPNIITTNAHCVEMLPVGTQVAVGLYDGNDNRPKMTTGKVLAYGSSKNAKDLAFIELTDKSLNRPPLPLWTKLDDAEEIVAIGNPHGHLFNVTKGIVSGLQRDQLDTEFVMDLTQTDAAVNPGNSGGPLFNMWGSVVGVNESIETESGGFEGASFAVPAAYIIEALKQYRRTGDLKSGAMQIEVSPDTTTAKMTIRKVVPDGPAALARLQENDQLLSVDGVVLDGSDPAGAMKAFLVHLKYMSPGETAVVRISRGGRILDVPVVLSEPKAPRPDWAPIPKKPKAGAKAAPTSYRL